jgi:hypothetical protein
VAECYDCGIPYGEIGWIESIIPNKVWDMISPSKNQGGLLCINCISKRLNEYGFPRSSVPIWLVGTESVFVPNMSEPDLAIDCSKIIHIDQGCSGEKDI